MYNYPQLNEKKGKFDYFILATVSIKMQNGGLLLFHGFCLFVNSDSNRGIER